MPLAVELVSPYAPPYPYIGGVVGDKVVIANGIQDSIHQYRWIIVDPDGTPRVRAFSATPPAGQAPTRGRWGATVGTRFWAAMRAAGSGTRYLFLRWHESDGSYDWVPSPYNAYDTPTCVECAGSLWCFSTATATVPAVYDLSSFTWSNTVSSSTALTVAQPVASSSNVFVWSSTTTLHRFPSGGGSSTAVTLPGGTTVKTNSQAITEGGYAYWLNSAGTHLIRLNMASSTVDLVALGVVFSGVSLAWSPSDTAVYSLSADGATMSSLNVLTGDTAAEPTGMTGGSGGALLFEVGGRLVGSVWS